MHLVHAECTCVKINRPSRGLVLTTGSNTTRGIEIIRQNNFSTNSLEFGKDLFFMALIMIGIAIIGGIGMFFYMRLYLHMDNLNLFFELMEITIVYLNPALFICLAYGYQRASENLVANKVFVRVNDRLKEVS